MKCRYNPGWKAQRGSTTTFQNKVRLTSLSVSYFYLYFIWKWVYLWCHTVYFGLPQAIGSFLHNIDISCDITTNTKRINKIHQNKICTNNLYLHLLENFLNFLPLFTFVQFFEVGTELPNLNFQGFEKVSKRNHCACFWSTLITITFSSGDSISLITCCPQNWNQAIPESHCLYCTL